MACIEEAYCGPGTLRLTVPGADNQVWELVAERVQGASGITLASLAPDAYDNVPTLCVWYDTSVLSGPADVVQVIYYALRIVADRLLGVCEQVRACAM